jgi:hypothetical protein
MIYVPPVGYKTRAFSSSTNSRLITCLVYISRVRRCRMKSHRFLRQSEGRMPEDVSQYLFEGQTPDKTYQQPRHTWCAFSIAILSLKVEVVLSILFINYMKRYGTN